MSLLSIFLQSTVAVTSPEEQGLSVFGLLIKGGPIMIPILLLSVVSLYLFVERLLFISKASRIDLNLVNNVKDMLIREDIKGALTYCDRIASPFSKLVHKGLSRLGSPMRDIESAIENTARIEVYKMEKNVNLLAAIAALAPMFGFLGTVVGMIRAFYDISMSDNISIGIIASGIYVKMITSASGLIVGVIAYIFYTYLNTKIERTVNRMEVTAIEFLDILYKPVL
jgi:biopolymer transport protein ExbB